MESQGYLGILHSNPLGVMCQFFFRCIAACSSLSPPAEEDEAIVSPVVARLPDDPIRRPRKPCKATLPGFLGGQMTPEAAAYFPAPAQISKSTTCGSCTSMYISFNTDALTNSVPSLPRTLPWAPCMCPKRCNLGAIFSTTLANSS